MCARSALSIGRVQWIILSKVWEHRPVSRIHYRVTLEDGMQLEVFKNMDHGGWYYLAGVLD